MTESSPTVVLVGLPGSGKTTVGRGLAHHLGVEFADSDAAIEALAGKAIPEIFVDEGEQVFRALEEQAVAQALSVHRGVLALGGGAILSASTRQRLAGHQVVYLEVSLPDAIARVGLGQGRPVLALNPRATLRALAAEREPLYREVARHTLSTSQLTPSQVVQRLAALLGRPEGTPSPDGDKEYAR
jgi:shikimate kinase